MNLSISAIIMFITIVLSASVGMTFLIYRQLFLPLGLAYELSIWWPRSISIGFFLGLLFYFINLRTGLIPANPVLSSLLGIGGLLFVCAIPVALLRWLVPSYQVQIAWGGLIIGVIAIGFALWQGARTPAIVKVDIKIDKWQGDPITIVQLTDLHLGQGRNADKAREIVNLSMGLKPDVIAITGDLIDGKQDDAFAAIAPLKELSAPLGVYYITGNHENYLPYTDALLTHLKDDFNWQLLLNHHIRVTLPGNNFFQMVGINDYSGTQMHKYPPNPAKAFSGSDANLPTVLLAHQPRQWHSAEQFHPDLTLSGHTHGGQIWPFSYLVKIQQPWVSGLHKVPGGLIYVSTGTGLWGPPMRLFTRSEITHLTLHR